MKKAGIIVCEDPSEIGITVKKALDRLKMKKTDKKIIKKKRNKRKK